MNSTHSDYWKRIRWLVRSLKVSNAILKSRSEELSYMPIYLLLFIHRVLKPSGLLTSLSSFSYSPPYHIIVLKLIYWKGIRWLVRSLKVSNAWKESESDFKIKECWVRNYPTDRYSSYYLSLEFLSPLLFLQACRLSATHFAEIDLLKLFTTINITKISQDILQYYLSKINCELFQWKWKVCIVSWQIR